jgi:hypothetical protein
MIAPPAGFTTYQPIIKGSRNPPRGSAKAAFGLFAWFVQVVRSAAGRLPGVPPRLFLRAVRLLRGAPSLARFVRVVAFSAGSASARPPGCLAAFVRPALLSVPAAVLCVLWWRLAWLGGFGA